MANLYHPLPPAGAEEHFTDLLTRPGVKIERIVSTGQASAPGFWYDQEHTEWVLLLQGAAVVEFEGEAAPRRLGPGDHLEIAPRRRHRIVSTQASPPTVWLAVHLA
ncbi:MAG TPA: cupin domain-containing protein [Burkholderiales bacterium]|jgi:cupin 2 domain-containing protein